MNERNIKFKSLKESILAFKKISKKYDKVHFTIRSFITPEIQRLVKNESNITVIDKFLNKDELYQLYQNADIFVLPSHETSGISLLDAMSFELPVIALNIYDIPEVITDGKNGILIDGHKDMQYYTKTKIPYDYSVKFYAGIDKYSNYLVNQLEKNFVKLIEELKLRTCLGREARKTIETGEFSLEKRNEKLFSIFESATS